jgi:hypothetical protein
MSYHRISHSEADLSREEKVFAANVHQFAAVPARSLKDTLADVIPTNATWFDLLMTFLAGLFWCAAVITGALIFWVITP